MTCSKFELGYIQIPGNIVKNKCPSQSSIVKELIKLTKIVMIIAPFCTNFKESYDVDKNTSFTLHYRVLNSQNGHDTSLQLPQAALLPGGGMQAPDSPNRPLSRGLSEPFDNKTHPGICYSSSDAEKNEKRQELVVP